jgi:membrane-associated HD superfamily phosphohydrolase
MSYSSPRRHRSSRASSLNLPPNFFARAHETVRRPDVLFRVAAFILATLILWLVTGAGTPPFAFRRGDVPKRKIIGRVDFQRVNEPETEKRRQEARVTAEAVYENNPRLLEEIRQQLTNKVASLVQAETFDAVQADEKLKAVWLELSPPAMNRPDAGDSKP